jgi:hypothetical protein
VGEVEAASPLFKPGMQLQEAVVVVEGVGNRRRL